MSSFFFFYFYFFLLCNVVFYIKLMIVHVYTCIYKAYKILPQPTTDNNASQLKQLLCLSEHKKLHSTHIYYMVKFCLKNKMSVHMWQSILILTLTELALSPFQTNKHMGSADVQVVQCPSVPECAAYLHVHAQVCSRLKPSARTASTSEVPKMQGKMTQMMQTPL